MSDHDMDDRKNTTDQCQADPRTHSEKALDLIADRLRDVVLELRVGPIPDTLAEIRDRLPEPEGVNAVEDEPADITEWTWCLVRTDQGAGFGERVVQIKQGLWRDGPEYPAFPAASLTIVTDDVRFGRGECFEPAPDVDPDEALAMDLYHASLLIPPVKEIGSTVWPSERDHEMWLGVARAAREHIETEREDAPKERSDDRR